MSFRDTQQRALTSIYNRLGADVKYHHTGGVTDDIKAIDSSSVEYGPDGFLVTVQESETVYFVMRSDISKPGKEDFITDEDQRFDVLRAEPKGRFEWVLICREVID